jgi:outer membrane protein assembly factor BamB
VFISVANPAPLYGTAKFPDGSSRPGPNLFTDSLVAQTIYPGDLGGVETPMALAGGRLFVPWADYPTVASASGPSPRNQLSLASGGGGVAAIDAASGKVAWQQNLPSENFGGATIANDVVFTSTCAGKVYGFDVKTGKQLWSTQAPAGVNSFAAVDGDTVLVGAAASGLSKNPQFQLVAYSLSGTGTAATPTPAPTTTSGNTAPASQAPLRTRSR